MASASKATCEVLRVEETPDIDLRHAGCGVVVGDKLYLWGGETEDKIPIPVDSDEEGEGAREGEDEQPQECVVIISTLPRPSDDDHPFDVFDLTNLTWSKRNTFGVINQDVPSLGIGSRLSYHRPTHSILLFSGWDDGNFSSDVFRVSMTTWRWEVLVPEGVMKPSPRYRTGVLVHGNKLCTFGGVGLRIVENQDKGAEYKRYQNADWDYGWNNEYYEFDILEKKWDAPMSGRHDRPPPNGGHTFTKFDSYRAILFGGSLELDRTANTMYIFDLEKKEFEGPLCLNASPTYRTFATMCPLIDPESLCPGEEQTMLLLWGKEAPNSILRECWLFHCESRTWTQIDLGEEIERYWHVACSYWCQPGMSAEGLGQVVIYGGAKRDPSVANAQYIPMGNLIILSFGTKSLKRLCLSAIVCGLEEHGISDPDQLLLQLPDYVPPATKQTIITAYKAQTHVASSSNTGIVIV